MKQRSSSASRFTRSSIAIAITSSFAVPAAMAASGDPIGDALVAASDYTVTPPDIARDAAGEFVVTWIARNQLQSTVFGRLYAADGTPAGPAFVVSASQTSGAGEVTNPKVAMDPEGDFVIVWETISGLRPYPALSDSSIRAQRYSAGGSANGAPILVALNGTTPDVAMDDDGDFTVAWAVDGTITRPSVPFYGAPIFIPSINAPDAVRVRRFGANGQPLSLAATLATGVRGVQGLTFTRPIVRAVTVASDGAGNSVVGWLRDPVKQRTDPSMLEAQRVSAKGVARGASFTISSGDASLSGLQLAMNAVGELAAAYVSADGVHVKTYAPNGQPMIADLLPSSAVQYTPLSFSAAPGIAIDALGTLSVTASSGYDESARINLRLFDRSGLPTSAVVPVTDPSIFRSYSSMSAIAVDGAGNPVIAYAGFRLANPREFQINAQRYAGH